MLFQLADLSSVWINAEVPEAQAAWIKTGDPAVAEVPALPGERFEGQVDYLYPELTPTTRTLKVRVVVKNPGEHLRPGMFAAVHLRGTTQDHVLTVPTEAVIKTGTRSIVIVADDATHFRPALVRVGAEHGGRSEILEGLERRPKRRRLGTVPDRLGSEPARGFRQPRRIERIPRPKTRNRC